MRLHVALHLDADLGGRVLALGEAEPVEPGQRELGAVLAAAPPARALAVSVSLSLRPAARPKTTRSIRLFEPSRLAPWTETQAASPTA